MYPYLSRSLRANPLLSARNSLSAAGAPAVSSARTSSSTRLQVESTMASRKGRPPARRGSTVLSSCSENPAFSLTGRGALRWFMPRRTSTRLSCLAAHAQHDHEREGEPRDGHVGGLASAEAPRQAGVEEEREDRPGQHAEELLGAVVPHHHAVQVPVPDQAGHDPQREQG